MTTVTIGAEEFPSIAAAKRKASDVLRRWLNSDRFIDGEDLAFVEELFQKHPDVETKSGPGVAGFFVALRPGCRTANLHVVRTDGSVDDFSIKRCLGNAADA